MESSVTASFGAAETACFDGDSCLLGDTSTYKPSSALAGTVNTNADMAANTAAATTSGMGFTDSMETPCKELAQCKCCIVSS